MQGQFLFTIIPQANSYALSFWRTSFSSPSFCIAKSFSAWFCRADSCSPSFWGASSWSPSFWSASYCSPSIWKQFLFAIICSPSSFCVCVCLCVCVCGSILHGQFISGVDPFFITGPLWEESTMTGGIPPLKGQVMQNFDILLVVCSKKTLQQTVTLPVIWDAMLSLPCGDSGVSVSVLLGSLDCYTALAWWQ